MWAHLWTDAPMPEAYVDLLLCERFHWSIQDLYDAPADIIESFLVMWQVETQVEKTKSKNKGK